ncbi:MULTISPECIES: hypothetical protein [Streptomyces]|uniref:Secreted protein n=2 Tax=Streptomyces TaxID=1883 RepID=A0A1R1SSR4_9ACTN|nr:hypothetical protein [Streptomyces sparsogenes]OMI41267.1 hypothetical protein SPAR_01589 [Streptomyces sparsogenes DSM 40356]
MMRRLTTTAGILAAAGALTLSMATSASAAHGDLFNSTWRVVNPTGCVRVQLEDNRFHVYNDTNEYALAYANNDCSGPVIDVIPPGGRSQEGEIAILGRAVWIR